MTTEHRTAMTCDRSENFRDSISFWKRGWWDRHAVEQQLSPIYVRTFHYLHRHFSNSNLNTNHTSFSFRNLS